MFNLTGASSENSCAQLTMNSSASSSRSFSINGEGSIELNSWLMSRSFRLIECARPWSGEALLGDGRRMVALTKVGQSLDGGEGGIRTPDTLLGCNCLAGSPVRLLQHLSAAKSSGEQLAPISIAPRFWIPRALSRVLFGPTFCRSLTRPNPLRRIALAFHIAGWLQQKGRGSLPCLPCDITLKISAVFCVRRNFCKRARIMPAAKSRSRRFGRLKIALSSPRLQDSGKPGFPSLPMGNCGADPG